MGVICEISTLLVRMNELKFRVVCQDCPQSNFRRPLIAKRCAGDEVGRF